MFIVYVNIWVNARAVMPMAKIPAGCGILFKLITNVRLLIKLVSLNIQFIV